jgi:glycosyltransferase 2 family protein
MSLVPTLTRRATVFGLVVGVPASILFLWLAARGLDYSGLRRSLSNADPVLISLAVAAMLAVYAVQAARWRLIARHERLLPYGVFFGMVVASVAVNNVVPGRPGELLRGYWFSRAAGVPMGRGFGTVVVDRSADVLVLFALLTLTLPFVAHDAWVNTVYIGALILAGAVACALAVAWWYASRSPLGLARGRARELPRSGLRRLLSGVVRSTAQSLKTVDLVLVCALSVLAWFIWGAGAWLAAESLGIGLSGVQIVFATALINLGVAIPSSPGFVGTYQWLTVSTLALFGIGRTDAFAFSVVLHAIWYVPTTIIGFAFVLFAGFLRRDARRSRPAQEADVTRAGEWRVTPEPPLGRRAK